MLLMPTVGSVMCDVLSLRSIPLMMYLYNADETGWYFRALPEHTFLLKNENAKGVKVYKEQVTILCCCSMSGRKE